MLNAAHFAGLGITILIFTLLGLFATKMVKSLGDYLLGGKKLGSLLVSGGIVGGFVGGTVTIGSAQMAYCYGISGIWFTFGAGLACLLLFLFLARPLREKEVDTIPQFLAYTYGNRIVPWVSFFVACGMFIQIAVQMMAAAPMLTSILPLSTTTALLAFTALTIVYVLGGGFWSSSIVGLLKLTLLSATLLVAAYTVWALTRGGNSLPAHFSKQPWFSLFPRGIPRELAGGASALIGFISTQSCIQPLFAARNVMAARKGALLAAICIPLFGAAAVLVGMYMRMAAPGIDPVRALPLFILKYFPPWLAGMGLATLLVTLVLTSSAMALGIGTLFSQDIHARLRPRRSAREALLAARTAVVLSALAACLLAYRIQGTLILDWTYLSNALRGVSVFMPLMAVIFFGQRIAPRAGLWSVSLAPLCTILWFIVAPGKIHPLYIGLPISTMIIFAGIIKPGIFQGAKRNPYTHQS